MIPDLFICHTHTFTQKHSLQYKYNNCSAIRRKFRKTNNSIPGGKTCEIGDNVHLNRITLAYVSTNRE